MTLGLEMIIDGTLGFLYLGQKTLYNIWYFCQQVYDKLELWWKAFVVLSFGQEEKGRQLDYSGKIKFCIGKLCQICSKHIHGMVWSKRV